MSLLTRLGGTEQGVDKVQVTEKPVIKPLKTDKQSSKLEHRLHNFFVEEIKKPANQGNDIESLIEKLAEEFFEKEGNHLTFEQKKQLIKDVSHELTGYGPISPLLADPNVTEVMVNGPNDVYIEINGRIEKTATHFRDDRHVLRVIEKIVAPLGRRIDESIPMVDARLPDGSRVNAIIPPLALNGPTITIRKFSEIPFTIHELVRMGTLTENMAAFLRAAVEAKLNIFISGGTGSGKTSTLNVMSSFIPHHERIVTIEDSAELKLMQDHVVSLESRPKNIEGQGEITIRDLVRNSLRMRPDRVIIGEVRSAETLDMLQAMNTGHDGSLGTGHANTPRDLLARLETMVLMAGFDLPIRAIREQISGALDLIVQQARMRDGSRKIIRITEVLGLEGDTIVLQDIFVYKEQHNLENGRLEGKFNTTGIRPNCIERLELAGHRLQGIFNTKEEW
ncbi:type II secretion system protein E [Virgibacillus phasianinus]|uniref:Type II secretion system protein E n=1 Tax=Virgibacillus phasianinus TaxID=2017483 RepID=A0A220U185_9BACI|nr:CpaF family protein [Virgibacillus phasianinus]ASK61830.1 type II secretion system protein E [Virgibacillus phasianinus]